jgi:hypothetical protein
MAEYVYAFIRTFIEAQWRDYNRNKGLNRYRKTDFAVGIIEGFRDKLESHINREKTSQTILALIQQSDPQLENYVRFRYPYTASIQKAASRQNARVIKDGQKLGQQLIIAKGVCERKTAKPPMIEGPS